MDAGLLNKRITFLASSMTPDAAGQPILTWTPVCTVWASIKAMSGQQLSLSQANTITSTATHSIWIRYNPLLAGQVNYRITYADSFAGQDLPVRIFRINSIQDPDEQHFDLQIKATSVAA